MGNLDISEDELQMLLQLIDALAIAPNYAQFLDDVVAKINGLVPFEKCVLLHERRQESGTITAMYEFHGFPLTGGRRSFRGEKSSTIGRCLAGFRRLETFQNAFFWYGSMIGDDSLREDVFPEPSLRQGVGGVVDAQNGRRNDGATLIQLRYPGAQFETKHLLFVSSIVFHLHSHFARGSMPPVAPGAQHNLTPKEMEVLQWAMEGKTSWEIGAILSMSERTVKFHLHNIYTKLNVVNRAQAVMVASQLHLVAPSRQKTA